MIKRDATKRPLRHARAQAIACAGYAFRLEAERVTLLFRIALFVSIRYPSRLERLAT